mmetsp:Transcript_96019/g.299014  ORF Transcript_96019/g.299014 Transcript_96019/m.299014 type:complete len:177 (-) Transcript_96019:4-534(-)
MSFETVLRGTVTLSTYAATVCSAVFVYFGIYLMIKDLDKRVNADSGFFCRLHWFTQGAILACASLSMVVFLGYTYIMGYPLEEETYGGFYVSSLAKKFGFLRTDNGRAAYFLIAGVYCIPLLNILDSYTKVSPFYIVMGYTFGLISVIASLLLVFANLILHFLSPSEKGEKEHLVP